MRLHTHVLVPPSSPRAHNFVFCLCPQTCVLSNPVLGQDKIAQQLGEHLHEEHRPRIMHRVTSIMSAVNQLREAFP